MFDLGKGGFPAAGKEKVDGVPLLGMRGESLDDGGGGNVYPPIVVAVVIMLIIFVAIAVTVIGKVVFKELDCQWALAGSFEPCTEERGLGSRASVVLHTYGDGVPKPGGVLRDASPGMTNAPQE